MTDTKKKAILVNVADSGDALKVIKELEQLAETADYETAASLTQRKEKPDKTYYIGRGKLEELKRLVEALGADIVIFDNDLSGSQFHSLEEFLGVDVIDRETLILEIFSRHARSNEGKLQVELAQKKKELPRIIGSFEALSRQGGGGAGGGGARRGGGEQQKELDRRAIKSEIKHLQEKIKKLGEERARRRANRQNSNVKTVSIVGYTNAGKSTLMNALTKAGVPEEDKLFATLDPVGRKLWLGEGRQVLVFDTVGFISRLPHHFVEAFKSTLEETINSDLILHVVDGVSEDILEQYDVVKEVLESIGAGDIPMLTVYNKCDLGMPQILPDTGNYCVISAKYNRGIDTLKDKISEILFGKSDTVPDGGFGEETEE
ncbi:MAG TPA: GTPase HflX [Clostridia bacterium]|nr:GTPase HflX [Clostridia bacterium]